MSYRYNFVLTDTHLGKVAEFSGDNFVLGVDHASLKDDTAQTLHDSFVVGTAGDFGPCMLMVHEIEKTLTERRLKGQYPEEYPGDKP